MQTEKPCQNCGSNGMSVFYEAKDIPIHSCLLLSSRDEALKFPRRDIALAVCSSCGFIANVTFDPQLMRYSPGYEEQQSFSPRFNAFARELATHLVNRYDIRNKDIVEIGCGKGDFLVLLCEIGHNRGLGIDPSYAPGRMQSSATGQVSFIQDFYSEHYAHCRADLVCCRHTLEHIHATRDFVRTVRRTVGDRLDTVIFFEVPDVSRILREAAFWDIYYEHCSYFSLGSLARLFQSCGFRVLDLVRAFDDQYLLVEARPANGPAGACLAAAEDLEQFERDVAYFAQNYRIKLDEWGHRFDLIRSKGLRAAIWGSSSKCVAFLSTLGIQDEIELVVVDINPYRHGKYLPGIGKQILPPGVLRELRPDTVIAMNPIYCDEIRQDLDRMGLEPELIAV
jgi:SAM-dependent methyltransferase